MSLERFVEAVAQLWCEARSGMRSASQLGPLFPSWLSWRSQLGRPFVSEPRRVVRVFAQGTMERGEGVAVVCDGDRVRAVVMVVENGRLAKIEELEHGRREHARRAVG